jgi:hypothetical protein
MELAEIYNVWNLLHLKKSLAGYTFRSWNTLVSDFILLAHKLEELGFTYCKGDVIILGSSDRL